jgi:hypothetical protein
MCVHALAHYDGGLSGRRADIPGCLFEAKPRIPIPRMFGLVILHALSALRTHLSPALNLSVDARDYNLVSHLPENTKVIWGVNRSAVNTRNALAMGRVIFAALQLRSRRRNTSRSASPSYARSALPFLFLVVSHLVLCIRADLSAPHHIRRHYNLHPRSLGHGSEAVGCELRAVDARRHPRVESSIRGRRRHEGCR